MTKAICLSCGAKKKAPNIVCHHCGFDPKQNDDLLIKSIYLSIFRFDSLETDMSREEYSKQLDVFSERIQNGRPIEFDNNELSQLADKIKSMSTLSRITVWGAVFRFFFPGILFLTGMWLFYFLFRFSLWLFR